MANPESVEYLNQARYFVGAEKYDTNKKKSQSDNAKNQLQVIVDYVNAYCKTAGINSLNGICLPSLPDVIKKDSLHEFAKEPQSIVVPVGIYDDPERQDQGNYCIDLSENNTYIIGSAMTGKTTLPISEDKKGFGA